MGYYMAPGGRGDYYTGRGDLLGFIKKAGSFVGKTALGFLGGGPVGAAGAAAGAVLGRPASRSISIAPPAIGPVKLGPTISYSSNAGPPMDLFRPRRRRMNPANPKALRRALRRVQGFGALAARASADVARANRSLNRIPRKTTKKRR